MINNADAFSSHYAKHNNAVLIIVRKAVVVVIMLLSGTHVVLTCG